MKKLLLILVGIGISTTVHAQYKDFSKLFKFYKITNDTIEGINLNRNRIVLDVNERLKIVPQNDSLLAMIKRGTSGMSEQERQKFKQDRKQILSLLQHIERQLYISKRLLEISKKFNSRSIIYNKQGCSESGAEQICEEYTKLVNEFGEYAKDRREILTKYFETEGLSGNELRRKVGGLEPRRGDYSKLRDFANSKVTEITKKLDSETESIARDSSGFKFRMKAELIQKGSQIPIHLPGYDEYEYGTPKVINKISFQFSEEEKKKLREDYKFYQDLATTVKDIGEHNVEMKRRASELVHLIDSTLKALPDYVNNQLKDLVEMSRTDLNALSDSLDHDFNEVDATTLKNIKDQIVTITDSISSVESRTEALYDKLKTVSINDWVSDTEDDPVNALFSIVDNANTIAGGTVAEVRSLRSVIENDIIKGLENLRTEISKQAPTISEELFALLEKNVDDYLKGIEQKAKYILVKDNPLVDLYTLINTQNQKITNADVDPPALDNKEILSKPLGDLLPTELNLINTNRKPGDYIRVSVEIRQKEKIWYEHSENMLVQKLGWYTDVSAGLVFVSNTDLNYPNSERFAPLPVATFLFRYQTAKYNVSSFSVGFHTISLNQDPNVPVELGVGGNIHVIGDVLQFGYGVNLHAKDTPTYWYFGLGVLDILQKVRGQ
ncbi:MAG: hypothetical protein FH748_06990 [Balneolaceae bacterium]|nr:hypothetical protein [Balneolaceae bacterium]